MSRHGIAMLVDDITARVGVTWNRWKAFPRGEGGAKAIRERGMAARRQLQAKGLWAATAILRTLGRARPSSGRSIHARAGTSRGTGPGCCSRGDAIHSRCTVSSRGRTLWLDGRTGARRSRKCGYEEKCLSNICWRCSWCSLRRGSKTSFWKVSVMLSIHSVLLLLLLVLCMNFELHDALISLHWMSL